MDNFYPGTSDLECLIRWPLGTLGEQAERRLMRELLKLCGEFGFGRVPQVASQIEELWRDPGSEGRFQAEKEDALKLIAADIEAV